jgi:predicted Zn-dependent peptidase
MLQPKEMLRDLERVTATELQAVARDLFRPGRMSLGVVGPEVDEKLLKEASRPFYL